MRRAELIRDGAQSRQRPRTLPQHPAAVEADAVHDEVRMDVLPVDMGGDEHLALRPRPCRKLLGDLVCQLTGDRLIRGEGLHIVIKPDGAFLAVRGAGGEKLLRGQLRGAILSADELLSILLHRLVLLRHIRGNAVQRTSGLLFVFDVCHRRHQHCSCPARVHRPM